MESNRFDEFTKRLSTGISRRDLIKGLGSGVLGGALAMLGRSGADARSCRGLGRVCRNDANCCPNSTCQPGAAGRKVCTCAAGLKRCGGACIPVANCCTAADCQTGDQCHAPVCDGGMCGARPLTGNSCDDGNPCTTGDVCQDGSCVGTPVTCSASDQCHDAGVCDNGTGTCTNPPKQDGAPCDDGHACSKGDTCQSGVCTAGTWVVCQPSGPCIDRAICDSITGECIPVPKRNGIPCSDSNRCIPEGVCRDGECYGVTACPVCQACVSGTCSTIPALPFPDPRCTGGMCCGGQCVDLSSDDDHCGTCFFSCVSNSSCQNGVCQGPDCVTPLSCGVQGNPF